MMSNVGGVVGPLPYPSAPGNETDCSSGVLGEPPPAPPDPVRVTIP